MLSSAILATVRPTEGAHPGRPASARYRATAMVLHALQPTPPLAADGAALAHVLKCAGVTKRSPVRVVGPAGLIAVIWLCRNGYERAVLMAGRLGSKADQADAVLIPHACGCAELADLLEHGVRLGENGVLIVQANARRTADDVESVPSLLVSRGYQIEQSLLDKGRAVYIARRHEFGGFKAAA